jgi:SAM-dependent methyltransferase
VWRYWGGSSAAQKALPETPRQALRAEIGEELREVPQPEGHLATEGVAELGDRCESIEQIVARLPEDSTVLDVGCFGWRLAEQSLAQRVRLVGADLAEPPGRPHGVGYASIKDNQISMPDSQCDLVVATHVLEHVVDAMGFMRELVRAAKPGGLIFLEAPSELACIPPSSNDPSDHRFLSFWDDPTHVRPWTPGAMYRLALSCQAMPVSIQRADAGGIPSVQMIAQKPTWVAGRGQHRFVSLRKVEAGLQNAWEAVWGKHP